MRPVLPADLPPSIRFVPAGVRPAAPGTACPRADGPPRRALPRRPAAVLAAVWLAACTAGEPTSAVAGTPWPPGWQVPAAAEADLDPVRFEPPSADNCRRMPVTREVPGRTAAAQRPDGRRHERAWPAAAAPAEREDATGDPVAVPAEASPRQSADVPRGGAPSVTPVPAAAVARAPVAVAPPSGLAHDAAVAPVGSGRSDVSPRQATQGAEAAVTAGVVDDNADFGAYLAYRARRSSQLAVRDRDVTERYRVEVTDATGRPLHDAEVAVQRPGVAAPVAVARTDTAGRVWLHPRAFLPGSGQGADPTLELAVRHGRVQGRAVLVRGQADAVQLRLATRAPQGPRRLDLVFLVDATGSMGDEIAKLKTSMGAMSAALAQGPSRPDICYGLVAYRDRGDAFLTRTHDFTARLDAFQAALDGVAADGGGDTPEAFDEALAATVHGLSWRRDAVRLVVLVADAPPHMDRDGPRYDREMQAALAKGIKVFAVGASGLDPAGEHVFRQVAQFTGGRFVFLTYRDRRDPASGAGRETVHDVAWYAVDTLDRLVVRLVGDELAR